MIGKTGTYPDYHLAHGNAVLLARSSRKDVGIERAAEFGKEVFRVFRLPLPQNRFGFELRCEVVGPDDPMSAPDLTALGERR